MKRIPHSTIQYGNGLYESVSKFFDIWKNKPIELCLSAIKWGQNQILYRTQWGFFMMDKFDSTTFYSDAYGKNSFFEYLNFMKDPTVYGTEYDVLLLSEFFSVSIEIFSSSSISFLNGYMDCPPTLLYGSNFSSKITLWHENEHYESIFDV
jgi:hypothetical protein